MGGQKDQSLPSMKAGEHMKANLTLWLILMIAVTSLTKTQQFHTVTYKLEHDSQLWLEGSATLGSYVCQTAALSGMAGVQADDTSRTSAAVRSAASRGTVNVEVQVRMLDCGNGAMNKDMFKALDADRFPTISYALVRGEIQQDTILPGKRILLRTIGNLSIAGVTKSIDMAVQVVPLADGRYQIAGKKELSMRDFGIQPPSAFFGLIKAHERLTVCFNLIAVPEKSKFASHQAVSKETE